MKRCLLGLLAILAMSACTPVDDFGSYWDKGSVDPGLEGSWKKVGLPGQKRDSVPGADMLRFAPDGGSYAVQGINAGASKDENAARLTARSLRIGHGRFLMARPAGRSEGLIQRYEIEGNLLKEYAAVNGWAVEFLEAKHPEATSVTRNPGEGKYLVIKQLDDEAFQIPLRDCRQPRLLGPCLYLQAGLLSPAPALVTGLRIL